MKCFEPNCFNECRYVCTCQNFCYLCLSHLFYHSEICNKPKKTLESFSSTLDETLSKLKETKTQVLESSQKLTKLIQSLASYSIIQLNNITTNIKLFDQNYNRLLCDRIDFCKEKVLETYKVCENLINDILPKDRNMISNERMEIEPSANIQITMPEFFEYCIVCMKKVEKIQFSILKCEEEFNCKVCIKCRILDMAQCIACNRFYTEEEYNILNS